MQNVETDVAVIGAGTAGLNARRAVERANKRWLLIEQGPYGTMCARTGCMPSKLLIAAADAAHRARRASLFGVQIAAEAIRVDGRAVLARLRRERDRFVELTTRATEKLPAAQRLTGTARFVGPSELMVGDHTLVRARAFVIATGSTPIVPRELEPAGDALLTTDTLFERAELPDAIAVFGTGAIGLELGQALHHLGVRVAFYNPFEALGPFTDPAVVARVREVFGAELDLTLGAQVTDVRRDGGAVVIRHREQGGAQKERRFSCVLAAVGRRPQVEALHLEAAGIECNEKGVPLFDRATQRCGDSAIYLAGDVDGDRTILHEAVDDGRIAGENAAQHPSSGKRRQKTTLQIAFTSPQIAMVGESHKRATESLGEALAIGEASYDDQGRARVMGQNRGIVRLYADRRDQRLIGAELFGPAVEHTGHLLAWSVQQQLTVDTLLNMPVYHPTVEEGIRTALRSLARELAIAEAVADSTDAAGG